jgi:hypothetical protein
VGNFNLTIKSEIAVQAQNSILKDSPGKNPGVGLSGSVISKNMRPATSIHKMTESLHEHSLAIAEGTSNSAEC